MTSKTGGKQHVFIYSPELDKGGYPDVCPFNTRRAGMTRKTISSMGWLSGSGITERAPERCSREELEKYHSPAYLDAIKVAEEGDLSPEAFLMGLGTPDCPVFKGMYDYVSLAAGGSTLGARLILDGEADIVFNPSGGFHHACREKAGGFCYVNDVVLAAMAMVEAGKRVLVLDVDAHHCDGVQDAFYDSKNVMTISLHESGKTLFPGTGFEDETGAGAGKGFTVNIPLPSGTHDDEYMLAFNGAALPLIKAYAPDIIIMELGMDALSGDPLAHLRLTNNVLADIIEVVMNLDKPILATGGGGYDVEQTVRGWSLAWSILCGEIQDDMVLGMGGVMMETTEWSGGLRDRALSLDQHMHEAVKSEVSRVVEKIRLEIFPIHGI